VSHRLTKLAFTPGEPAGIGPDLCIQFAQQPHQFQLVAFADPVLLQNRAKQLGYEINLIEYAPHFEEPSGSGRLYYKNIALKEAADAGRLNKANAAYVLESLSQAVQDCQLGELDALVTGPVHKGIINEAGISFTGHTEFLAEKTNTPKVVMMLATAEMKVALATTHLPLNQVSEAITQTSLTQVIRILAYDLEHKFGLDHPHILVCGLNPHAGEGGHLGMEEINTLIPVIQQLKSEGLNLTGPLPADTLFAKSNLEKADAVLAMYHDQGLPVLKYQGFGQAVNVTLGLPIIRTSVDHGTALELAGSGRAETGSLEYAIKVALEMIKARHRQADQ
jgi:4-hydroxythreonine-4-phosphate dehydrogenase